MNIFLILNLNIIKTYFKYKCQYDFKSFINMKGANRILLDMLDQAWTHFTFKIWPLQNPPSPN